MSRPSRLLIATSALSLAGLGGASSASAETPLQVAPHAPYVSSVLTDPPDTVSWNLIPSDPLFTSSATIGGTPVAWHFTKPNFPPAWDIAQGRGIRVAVIDSEFDTDNPDLRDKLIVRFNLASGKPQYRTADVKAKPGDAFHGSHVAGLVGAHSDNGRGTTGACLDCGLVGIKVGTSGDPSGTSIAANVASDIVEAIDYALTQGVRVISISIGFQRHYPEVEAAVNRAINAGVVVVASAGNSQQTAQAGQPNYPAAYGPAIAVGATDANDQIAEFSTQGAFVDVVAPGKDVVSTTDPNDQNVTTFEAQAPQVAVTVKSGTSMATPIVSGLAALMLSVRPDLSPAEVDSLLKSTARDLGIPGPDPVYGYGRIDALAAVNAARAYVRPVPPPPPAPPVAPPAPAVVFPSIVKGNLKASRASKVTLKVQRGSSAVKTTFALRTASKYRVKGKRRTVTLAPARTVTIRPGKGTQSVTLTLSRDGRSLLRRQPKAKGLRVVVSATPKVKGAKASRRTVTLKR